MNEFTTLFPKDETTASNRSHESDAMDGIAHALGKCQQSAKETSNALLLLRNRMHEAITAKILRTINQHYSPIFVDGVVCFVKVIVNGPATILFIEGRKVVCKCHDEPFDITKGILVCIAKHNGFSYSHMKSWLKQHGLEGSQDAELCHLWDIAEAMGFSKETVKEMATNAKYEVKIRRK